jgi:hypothetical protein
VPGVQIEGMAEADVKLLQKVTADIVHRCPIALSVPRA